MTHSFNTTLAERYGIEAAILIEHIYWWIHKNDCEEIEDMIHEGKVWCRSTAKGFAKYIPYMKPDKIWRTLKKLEGHVLLVGNFNRQALNQTLWYTFTDEFKKELEDLNYDFENFKNANLKNEKSEYNIKEYKEINKEKNKTKVLSKKEEKKVLLTDDEQRFNAHMEKEYSWVQKMKEPLSFDQYMRLHTEFKYEFDQIEDILSKMDNYPNLHKSGRIAYKTALNWLKREYPNREAI